MTVNDHTILAFDIGSGSIRAQLADFGGHLIADARVATPQVCDADSGVVEFSGDAILEAVLGLLRKCSRQAPPSSIGALVFSCLGTSMLPVDPAGGAVGPAISPLDLRVPLPDMGEAAKRDIYLRSGQNPDRASALYQLMWRKERESFPPDLRFMSLRAFMIEHLCGRTAEDPAWASRTMLYDLEQDAWASDLLDKARITTEMLPAVQSPTSTFAIRPEFISEYELAPDARAVVGSMDNCCGVLGACAPAASLVNVTGTFEHLAARIRGDHAPDFVMESGGLAFRWLEPGMLLAVSRTSVGRQIQEFLQSGCESINPLYLKDELPPGPVEEKDDTPQSEIIKLLDTAAFEMRKFLEASESDFEDIVVIGGAADAPASLQRKANILGKPLKVVRHTESCVMGALRIGWCALNRKPLNDWDCPFQNPVERLYNPMPEHCAAFDARYKEWKNT